MTEQTVDLRILSPSIEAEGGVSFRALPSSTTVGQLKVKIQDALPTHPVPERMRIIYQGRMLRDSIPLAEVFGRDTAQMLHNVHMVLREDGHPPGPRSSTAPPNNPFRATPAQPTNPFRAPARPQSLPPQQPQPGVANAARFPLPQALNNILNHTRETPPTLASQGQNAFQQFIAQQQQQRATGGQNPATSPQAQTSRNPLIPNGATITQGGIGPNGERWSVMVNNTTLTIPQQAGFGLPMPIPGQFANMLRPASPSMARDGNRAMEQVRQHLEAARRQVEIINSLLAPPGSSREERLQLPPYNFQRAATEIDRLNIYLDMMRNLLGSLVANPQYARNREVVSLQMDNETMRHATRNLIRHIHSHIISRRDQIQNLQPDLAFNPEAPADLEALLRSENPNDWFDMINRSMPGRQPNGNAAAQGENGPSDEVPSTPNQPIDTNGVFLLWGPEGPRGVLLSPQATLTSGSVPSLTEAWAENLAYQRALSDVARLVAPTRAAFASRQPTPQPTATQAAPADAPAQAQHAADPGVQAGVHQVQAQLLNNHPVAPPQLQQMAPPPQQGQVAIAAVLAGHLWILIRIFGFLYLFGGAGWRRTILLAVCGLAVYLVQMGFLGERFLGDRWDRVRRYFDNLVGIPARDGAALARGEGQAAAAAAAAAGAGGAEAAAPAGQGTRRRQAQPTPEEVARRLLAQREQQDRTWLRDAVRGAERATALFVASLWPGLGERMVAAREEAEAQVRRDRAEREERERREREAEVEAEAGEQARVAAAQEEATAAAGDAERAGGEGVQRGGGQPLAGEAEAEAEAVSVDAASGAADKGKGKERAVVDGEASASASSSSALPAGAGGGEGAAPRAREGWSFEDVD
ncbi:uncharacterized protein K452DRAFT_317527 [Aplosporella prunicola CBS 121167]|uniref:Ubiquitin-like domain-containing protein n=1 Tax=Aplosporella prunicola CBS 121167 TaxID=1176127 RepID=A0A6A6BGU0_9PEZI|nr:uncharacterized protein K452DRAFT_317527 [Aplosporella prunicola CBS 121167]KAF2143370.1 hypothetical protein K452DRAFT_317527 [Aplosporella prunicola CBS 121167]